MTTPGWQAPRRSASVRHLLPVHLQRIQQVLVVDVGRERVVGAVDGARAATQKTKLPRTIQTAVVLAGVAYESLVEVDYVYSDKSGGSIASRRGQ